MVSIHGGQGRRSLLLEDFFTGPGKTVLKPDELMTEIVVPALRPRSGKIYIKHGRRKAMELATVGVAVTLTEGSDVRIVLEPWRLRPSGRSKRKRSCAERKSTAR